MFKKKVTQTNACNIFADIYKKLDLYIFFYYFNILLAFSQSAITCAYVV